MDLGNVVWRGEGSGEGVDSTMIYQSYGHSHTDGEVATTDTPVYICNEEYGEWKGMCVRSH